ncbi:MAG: phenylalanine--tRNA ligase subunit alpha [Chlamydiia bacterium]|nr:phenylalanine--tRNA ligase subunit alpha [Chlamydiia bacterium]
MKDSIAAIRQEVSEELKKVQTVADVDALKVRFLGRKGPIQALFKDLKDVPAESRPQAGAEINALRDEVEEELSGFFTRFLASEESLRLAQEALDVTLAGRKRYMGRVHPVARMMDEAIDVLKGMGFSVQVGPDIDTDYYNFESLNFAPDHPARDMQDTFYIDDKVLLRTQTTNIQVRTMEQHQPPIRIICPGKCFRNESITARSHVIFHQIDGFYVDKGVTFRDLLHTLETFIQKMFGSEAKTRFRPSYFPFVEPGMEVDVSCLVCGGKGCGVCKHSGWLEILGAGMVHPEVLKNGGIDPEVYSGFAWGMGIERLLMLRRGIKDIRLFTENDQRFLEQFV